MTAHDVPRSSFVEPLAPEARSDGRIAKLEAVYPYRDWVRETKWRLAAAMFALGLKECVDNHNRVLSGGLHYAAIA